MEETAPKKLKHSKPNTELSRKNYLNGDSVNSLSVSLTT